MGKELTVKLPTIPGELRSAVDLSLQGPLKWAGMGDGDPGFAIMGEAAKASVGPVHHPDAQRFADALAPMLEPPESPQVVRDWIDYLSGGVAVRPSSEDIENRTRSVCFACSDLPRGVWTRQTLIEALRTFRYFPSVAEIRSLLEPHAKRMTAEHATLERIANAGPRVSFVRSTTPYDPGPASPEEPPKHFHPKAGLPRPLAPVRSVDEQIAAVLSPREPQ